MWENRFISVLVEGESKALAFYGNLLCGDAAEPWKTLGYAPNRSRRGRPPKKPPETAKQEGGATESAEPTVAAPLEPEVARQVFQNKAKVPMGSYLRSRVRYFSDGMVFGSEEFVEGVFRKNQRWFGANRKTGARKMRGLAQGELFTARELQLNVFGKAGPGSVPPSPNVPPPSKTPE